MPTYRPQMDISDYADLIDRPHHVSLRHPQMDRSARAAQFNAYQALNGYGDLVEEAARVVQPRPVLDENDQALLNDRLAVLSRYLSEQPEVVLSVFRQDAVQDGGTVEEVRVRVRRIDPVRGLLYPVGLDPIALRDLVRIDGDVFDVMND